MKIYPIIKEICLMIRMIDYFIKINIIINQNNNIKLKENHKIFKENSIYMINYNNLIIKIKRNTKIVKYIKILNRKLKCMI